MNLERAHIELRNLGVGTDSYYLQGLFGSTDDNEKFSLITRKGKYTIEYEVYFKERGEISSSRTFTDEEDALEYFVERVFEKHVQELYNNTPDILGMTLNERLFATGLLDVFDRIKRKNKPRARQLLKGLKTDELSIKRIIK